MIKYVLHPGEMLSKFDDTIHFIGVRALASLYNVRFEECVISDSSNCLGIDTTKLVHLYPRYDGDYTLPKSTNEKEVSNG